MLWRIRALKTGSCWKKVLFRKLSCRCGNLTRPMGTNNEISAHSCPWKMETLSQKPSFLQQKEGTFPPDNRFTWHGSTASCADLQRKLHQNMLAWLRGLEPSSDSSAPTETSQWHNIQFRSLAYMTWSSTSMQPSFLSFSFLQLKWKKK